MRLIDSDALLKELDDMRKAEYSNGNYSIYNGISIAMGLCESIKEVDAVPVVRCRDCQCFGATGKYAPDDKPYGYCYHWNYEYGMSPNEVDGDDFCSYAVKETPRPDCDCIEQGCEGNCEECEDGSE